MRRTRRAVSSTAISSTWGWSWFCLKFVLGAAPCDLANSDLADKFLAKIPTILLRE